MEEKTTKLSIINGKVNLNFLKSVVSPIQIPKLKSSKIFNTKCSEKPENTVPAGKSLPESNCVDRSPARISTISSLVDGAPDYDYSFGHISISDSKIEMSPAGRERPNQNDQIHTKPFKFSEKLAKQYKDFSEFKFKHILGKKTVVRTTSIEVENYSHRLEDLISERSDGDFEFHSLPAGTGMGNSFEDEIQSTPEIRGSRRKSITKPNRIPSVKFQEDAKVKPNESSLWKHVHSMSQRKSAQKTDENPAGNQESSGGISKRSFNKQTIEDACNKAKITVTQKLQKFMSLPGRTTDPKSTLSVQDSYKGNLEHIETMSKTDDTTVSRYNGQYHSRKKSFGGSKANAWKSESCAQNSIDSEKSTSRHYLRSESSIDSDNEGRVSTRIAPPAPSNYAVPSKDRAIKTKKSSDTQIIGRPRPVRSNVQEESWRGHARRPSAESMDPDSWIPDVFNRPNRNQINLEIIPETSEAWCISKSIKGGLQKFESVDIFNDRGSKAFEDFDDALKNVPTIQVHKNSVNLKPKFETKPLVKQSSIFEKEDDAVAARRRSLRFNKLVSRFENSSKSLSGSSSGSLNSNSDNMTVFESKITVHRWNRKEYDNDDDNGDIKERNSLKPIVNGKALPVYPACKNEKIVSSIDEEIDDDIFHSLGYNESIPSNVQLSSSSPHPDNGDQILALNNNLSAVQPIGTSAAIIDEPSDEVLLRFVRHLASFKQNKNDDITDNNSSEKPQNSSETLLEDENKNYKTQWIDIENCENYIAPATNQQTFLSHELLKENSQDNQESDSEEEFSDAINEVLSCSNDLNGYDSQLSKNPFIDLKENNNNNSCYETSEEFITANDQQQDYQQDLLAKITMGSNVSRNSGKGLTGRRTQSSGNLYSDKHHHQQKQQQHQQNVSNANGVLPNKSSTLLPSQSENIDNYGLSNHNTLNSEKVSETCPRKLMVSPLNIVSKKDRNKFCGSLPNHLDTDDVERNSSNSENYNIVEDINAADQIEYVTVRPSRKQHLNQQQQQQQQQQQSPYNNSLSEKETASTSSGSSTFKINQDRPDIQLKLPLTRSNFDPSCDQGYGSERSPEDEFPPSMPNLDSLQNQLVSNPLDWDYNKCNAYAYNFITKDCTFCVQITKGSRGLGFSISGGIDSNAPFPGLIRIKRLFPHQAAWSTGKLQPGDIILEVNGIALTGLTNYEALEVLRTMPNDVALLICRPDDEQYQKLSPPTEPPKPPQRTQQQATQTVLDETYPLQPLTLIQTNFSGEFEIIMVKQQGSLGFTLRKEDESILGHYVRALVREPATTDGRIRPGDKIVAVNDVPLSAMTHEQAVIFLRQAADTVKLRLYRDEAQTPVAAMSPTNSECKTICGTTKKTFLRPEAINLLSDLAYKKQIPSSNSTESSIKSTNSSPRRLKRGNKTNNSEVTSQSEHDTTDSKSSSNPQYLVSSQTTSVCSDSEQSIASQCSYIVQPANGTDELFKMTADGDKPDRPSFLDLAGQIGSTPVVPRKPRFQFTVAANAYELNNLDNEALDAPMYTGNTGMEAGCTSTENQLPILDEFTSLPCETFLIACKTESDLKNEANFSHKNPMYQSAHAQQVSSLQQKDDTEQATTKKDGNTSLLKWKGIVFSPEDEETDTPEAGSSCTATAGTNPTPATERDFDLKDFSSNANGHKIISVELNRGWNSRLGFSLQPHPVTQKTIISAIYSDSVAAKDGRLKVGDQLLTVNDESVEHIPTSEIIDLLRIIRGSIVVTVLRKDDPH